MYKVYNTRYKLQEWCDNHWLAHDVLNTSLQLDDFIETLECLLFYNKRGSKYRIFDYELGRVVYE
jgi:hypothetical protein